MHLNTDPLLCRWETDNACVEWPFHFIVHCIYVFIHEEHSILMPQVYYRDDAEQKQQGKGLHQWSSESSGMGFCVIFLLELDGYT